MTWQLSSFTLLALALAGGFAWYERRRPPARVVGVVAVLAALAVVGRLAFAAVPNVKPTTDIVLFAGYALGGAPGFAVGAIGAIASNVFLGQGPWTVWQMAAWGAVGIGGALLARATHRRELGRVELAIYCGLAGFAFGALMDVYQWTLAARQDLSTYLAIAGTSLPYNIAHALGNAVFCLLIGPVFVRSLRRYRRRFEVTWAPPAARHTGAGGALAALAVGLAVATALTISPRPAAAAPAPASAIAAQAAATPAATGSPVARGAAYLVRAQNRDGGFGGSPGQSSSQLMTGWSALGLAAAGVNPRDVARRGGDTAIDYLRAARSRFTDVGELQRTILVLRAAGISPHRFAGSNLLAKLRRSQAPDGSWKRNIAWTAFGLMALRAAREPASSPRVRKAAAFLDRSQAPAGGWGFVPGSPADVDDTGAVLQALAAAGRSNTPAVRDGAAYLRNTQSPDGGWGQLENRDPNAQSTSWAIQGLIAARAPLTSLRADPLAYLRNLQRRDGHFSYSTTSDQTPVWVTAQALAALQRKPLPLKPVRRGAKIATATAENPNDDSPTALIAAGVAAAAILAAGLAWKR
ncbi:MAG TPA: prenyltransferase/squalene oxidase repeat-containing protein [Thermoleophilaceae bacterium]|nr:prenyltransferase/squalene oxidase repeat-containing protein [Thermoleophilaceae bacterium]